MYRCAWCTKVDAGWKHDHLSVHQFSTMRAMIQPTAIRAASSLLAQPVWTVLPSSCVRRNSTNSTFQSMLQKELLQYFDEQKFRFAKDSDVEYLRAQMEKVYLRQVPLVSVDVEAYERALTKVTEIGVAIYDPKGQDLLVIPHIQTLHIIIKEHRRLVNGSFVPNNKKFFNGGTSYEMTKAQLKAFLAPLFEHYFVARKAMLVGHSVHGDVKWLQSYGLKDAGEIPTLDTQRLYQLSRRRGATLRGILRHIGILHAHLHNAANDAYYTLLAALKYCDPARRIALGLDRYDGLGKSNQQTKVQKAAEERLAMLQKFSDKSTVVSAVPNVQDFLLK